MQRFPVVVARIVVDNGAQGVDVVGGHNLTTLNAVEHVECQSRLLHAYSLNVFYRLDVFFKGVGTDVATAFSPAA